MKAKFYLSYHWWLGQFVIRGQAIKHWDLRLDEDKPSHRYWTLDKDPTYVQANIDAIEKKCDDERWLTFEGIIPPNPKAPEWLKPGNPNKRIVAHVDRIDSGSVTILEDSPTFISFIFDGKELKGYWIMKKAMPQENVWVFEKSKLPMPEKQSERTQRTIVREDEIIRLTNQNLSRPKIAKMLNCSTSTVFIYQRKHNLV